MLRDILLSEGLTEELKWRKPCYTAHGGNLAILAAMKDAVAVSFLKGALLDDPDGRLETPGPNSRSARYMKFGSTDDIERDTNTLRSFVKQAVTAEKEGRRVDMQDDDFDLPEELESELSSDLAFAKAWDALTPGRRRGWVIHFSGAKQSETRRNRVQKAKPEIAKGRGLHDR